MEAHFSKKDALIRKISAASEKVPFSDFLLEFMEWFGLDNLKSATVSQLEEYIEKSNVKMVIG